MRGLYIGNNYGFPTVRGGWCKKLKYGKSEIDIPRYILQTREVQRKSYPRRLYQCRSALRHKRVSSDPRKLVYKRHKKVGNVFSKMPTTDGEKISVVQYLGLAIDEPERTARYQDKKGFKLPLVEIGWDEAYCRKWCEENDLLSPIYTTATRGGVLVLSQPIDRTASAVTQELP